MLEFLLTDKQKQLRQETRDVVKSIPKKIVLAEPSVIWSIGYDYPVLICGVTRKDD